MSASPGSADYSGAMKQVGFIVGTGRCGTTILAQVLNSHSRVCVPHELQIIVSIGNGDRLYEKYAAGEFKRYGAEDFIGLIGECCPYHFERYFDYTGHFRSLTYPQTDLVQVLTGLFDHMCFSFGKEIFLEQTPWYGQRLDTLLELFPGMKVIHLVRDGRDVALSFARTPWWSRDIGSNLRQWEREVTVIHDFVTRNPLICEEVRYEDLVLHPETWLQRIMALFHADFEPAMLDPGRLIDYHSFFRGSLLPYQSAENKVWGSRKDTIFFADSLYAWKKSRAYDFSVLPDRVAALLERFKYEL